MSRAHSGAAAGAAGTEEPQWEPAPQEDVAKWLAGKTPADFDAIEVAGRAMYPELIRRRNPRTGKIEAVRVLMKVPDQTEQMLARLEALDWCRGVAKLDSRPTKQEAEALWGADYFDQLDTIFLLARCLYDHEPLQDGNHPRYMTAENLAKMHPTSSLVDVYERLSHYQAVEDPRIIELDETQFVNTVLAIARVKNLSPLVVIDGRAHGIFVATMAERLAPYLTQ